MKKMAEWFLGRFQYVRELERRAFHDELTGLLRRGRFFEHLNSAISRCKRRGWVQYGLVLYYIDLNKFKEVNDTYGHYVGDQYLRFVAKSLLQALPEGTCIGRMGGDEFAIFSRVFQEHAFFFPKENALWIADHMGGLTYCHDQKIKIRCGVSVGYATTYKEGFDPDCLIIAADKDMYAVKRRLRQKKR